MPIPTEPIGSVPRPPPLREALEALEALEAAGLEA
jgi:methionine synthase II (cobalamin-independent)